jgi:hypothetical protein
MRRLAHGSLPALFCSLDAMQPEASLAKKRRTWPWLGILGVVALFVALRWNSFNAPLIRDEGEYAYSARLLIQGVAPYEHSFIQKPPMVIYSYAFASLCFPKIFWAPRLLAIFFVALATPLLGYAARLEFGQRVAWWAMCLMTPLVLMPGVDQFTANTEMFMLLPLLAMVAVYVRSRGEARQTRYWLAAGCLAATTLLYKYTALPVAAFLFLFWSVELWRGTRKMNLIWRCWLAAWLGAMAAGGLELGYFLARDGGAHLWECTVLFNRYYAATNNFNLAYLWMRLGIFWQAWWILFLVPLAIFLRPPKHIWFWVGLLISALIATNASGYGQYYVVAMPFWAMLAAVGIHMLGGWLGRWVRGAEGLIMIAVMLLVLRPDVPWLLCSPERFTAAKMDGFPFAGSMMTALRVAALSSPDDFVFVAGSEPQILCYAGRFSPTRFITAYAMMIPTPVAQKYQEEAIHDLLARPPKLIVFTTVPNSWLRQAATPADFSDFLGHLLRQDYVLVGGHLSGGQNGRWVEPLTSNEMAGADLWLYQRRLEK